MSLAWGWIGWVVFGGIAGWIASKIMKSDASMGIGANIAAGIAGGLLGGFILGIFFNGTANGFWSFLTAIAGACLVIWLVRLIKSKVGK